MVGTVAMCFAGKKYELYVPTRMCVLSGGTSQFSLMELSQSQDLCSEATNNHRGDNGFIASLPEEGATKSGRTDFIYLFIFQNVFHVPHSTY